MDIVRLACPMAESAYGVCLVAHMFFGLVSYGRPMRRICEMSAVTGRALRALKGARFRVFGVALRAGMRWGFLLLGAVSESTVDRLRAFSETDIRTSNRLTGAVLDGPRPSDERCL